MIEPATKAWYRMNNLDQGTHAGVFARGLNMRWRDLVSMHKEITELYARQHKEMTELHTRQHIDRRTAVDLIYQEKQPVFLGVPHPPKSWYEAAIDATVARSGNTFENHLKGGMIDDNGEQTAEGIMFWKQQLEQATEYDNYVVANAAKRPLGDDCLTEAPEAKRQCIAMQITPPKVSNKRPSELYDPEEGERKKPKLGGMDAQETRPTTPTKGANKRRRGDDGSNESLDRRTKPFE